jgi:hypothetical protein
VLQCVDGGEGTCCSTETFADQENCDKTKKSWRLCDLSTSARTHTAEERGSDSSGSAGQRVGGGRRAPPSSAFRVLRPSAGSLTSTNTANPRDARESGFVAAAL